MAGTVPRVDTRTGSYAAQVTGPESDTEPIPSTLRWAVRLLFAEAAVLTVVTMWLFVLDLTAERTARVSVAIGVTVFAALAVVVLLAVARALAVRRSGARGPAMVLQLMLLVIGYYMVQGGLAWLGVPVLLVGLSTGLLIVSPATTRALGLR